MSTTAEDVVRKIKGVAQGLLGVQPNTAQFAPPDQQQSPPQPPVTGGSRRPPKTLQSQQNASVPTPSGPASRVPGALANPATPDNSAAATAGVAGGLFATPATDPVGNTSFNPSNGGVAGAPRFDPVPPAPGGVPPTYPAADASMPFPDQIGTQKMLPSPEAYKWNLGAGDRLDALKAARAARGGVAEVPRLLPTNTVNGMSLDEAYNMNAARGGATAANDAAGAVSPGVATGATDAATQAAAKGLFSRAAGLVGGLAKRFPVYNEAVQGARALVDNRMITAGSSGSGTAADVPQALGGALIGAPFGMSPAEARTAMIRSNATDKAASGIVASDPALSKQKEAGSFWGDMANAMGGDMPPSSDQQYLNPSQMATANAAGVAAAIPEVARQNAALAQPDEVNHAARGGSLTDRFLGTLNNFNPQRDSTNVTPAPAYDPNATPGKPYQPGDLANTITAAMKKGGATPAQIAAVTKGTDQPSPIAANLPAATNPASANAAISLAKQVGSAFGLGTQPSVAAGLPNGQPPAPLDMVGSGTDSKGAFNLVRNADGSTSIQRGGKTSTGGSVNYVPEQAFSPETARAQAVRDSIAAGNTQANPSANLGGGIGGGVGAGVSAPAMDSAMRDYQDTVRDTIKSLGPINNNSKRQLLGELLGHLGQNVGVGANVGLEGQKLAVQEAEFPQTLAEQREASKVGRYGLQPVQGADGNWYTMDSEGNMKATLGPNGKPFQGVRAADFAKESVQSAKDQETGVDSLFKTMHADDPKTTPADALEAWKELHGAGSAQSSSAKALSDAQTAMKTGKISRAEAKARLIAAGLKDQADQL